MKKIIFHFVLLIILSGCNGNDQNKPNKKNLPSKSEELEDTTDIAKNLEIRQRVIEKIKQLPEFIESQKYIDSITDHKRGISYVLEEPSEQTPYYYVMVGYNNEIRFEPYYHFFIDPKTLEVKIEDVLAGGITPIEEWRRKKSN